MRLLEDEPEEPVLLDIQWVLLSLLILMEFATNGICKGPQEIQVDLCSHL